MQTMKNETESFTKWHGLFLCRFFALLVALATTIIPSKTGSKYGISDHFFEKPTFLQEFMVNFVCINIMLVLLVIGIAIWVLKDKSKQSPPTDE